MGVFLLGLTLAKSQLLFWDTERIRLFYFSTTIGTPPQSQDYTTGAGEPCSAPIACAHGTIVAGVVASQDSVLTGVAKGANLISIRVFSHLSGVDCIGQPDTPTCAVFFNSDLIAALDRVVTILKDQYQIAAVNVSLAEFNKFYSDQRLCDADPNRATNALMKSQIDALRSSGIATVIASGNDSKTNELSFPGCLSSAVSVGASTKRISSPSDENIWTSSNSASFLSLVAPGVNIATSTTTVTGVTTIASGTSVAAPHVAGAWAILKHKKPEATVGQILNALQTTGFKITDTRAGANNRVNCRIQIDQALDNIPDKLVTLNIPESVAYGINNCGQIVGTRYTDS